MYYKDELFSPVANAKRRATWNKIKFQQGPNNSNYGKCWIRHPVTRACGMIPKNDIALWIEKGYELGRYQKDITPISFD